jgi:hypothetical protein
VIKNLLRHRKAIILLLSIVLVLISDYPILVLADIHVSNTTGSTGFKVSNEPSYFYLQINGTGPNYFYPVAYVNVSCSNPYANEIGTFECYMSLDNSSWTDIPFSTVPKIVELGDIQLNSLSTKIYVKCYFPPQSVQNQTASAQTIEQSFRASVNIDAPYTFQTAIITTLLDIALFSFFLQILDFLFDRNTKNKHQNNQTEGSEMSKVEENKGELEKLIDWEQNKQLFWAVVLLTATLGLAGVLVIDSLLTSTKVFVIVLGLALMVVLDVSFYRIATSLVNLRRYIARIGKISKLYKKELEDNAVLKGMYDWFVNTTDKEDPRLRTLRVAFIMILADVFILVYVGLVFLRILGYSIF